MVTINTQHHDTPPIPEIEGYKLPEWTEIIFRKNGHPHLFGELAKDKRHDGKAEIILNDFGKAVEKEIETISQYYPQVHILRKVVMPNHVHFIIHIRERLPEKKPLGFIINKCKSGVNRLFKEIVLGVPKETHMLIGSSEPKALSTRQQQGRAKHGGNGSKHPEKGLVFEPDFNDRILFRKGQLENMINYIDCNPDRLWEVINNRQYFEKVAGWRITLPYLPTSGTQGVGRWWQYYPGGTKALSAEGNANGLLDKIEISGSTMTMTFNAIGNRSLLKVPERMQIQCSRKTSPEDIENLIEDVLHACAHGVVIVSPCISEGEKRVARAVMDAGYSLIVIFPNGIPPHTDEYKPYGSYFDACARGQLLILSPWEFYAGRKNLTRWQCLMLNDIAAQLSL